VRERKHRIGLIKRETFVPRSYELGQEAQVDWYEAWVAFVGEGGYFRRNHLVPVPAVADLDALNASLLTDSRADEATADCGGGGHDGDQFRRP
jgi:hypothetical protein